MVLFGCVFWVTRKLIQSHYPVVSEASEHVKMKHIIEGLIGHKICGNDSTIMRASTMPKQSSNQVKTWSSSCTFMRTRTSYQCATASWHHVINEFPMISLKDRLISSASNAISIPKKRTILENFSIKSDAKDATVNNQWKKPGSNPKISKIVSQMVSLT